MPSKLILTLLGYALAACGLVGSIYAGYSHVKNIGYQEAKAEDALVFKKYAEERDAKLQQIADLSTTLVTESRENKAALDKSVAAILVAAKTKPLVNVKNGECTPSQTFSDSLGEINRRVNENTKGK